MKKFSLIIFTIIVIISTVFLSLSYKNKIDPSSYYKVYLEGELIGKIGSKIELETYINNEQKEIKEKYNVEDVFIPNGLEIVKEISYNSDIDEIEKVYEKIKQKSDFTIKGYQIKIGRASCRERV